MNLDRALQIHTAALALLGALFLGLGSETPLLPIALATAAVLSVLLNNVFPWLRVNRIIANLIALGAVAWSMRDFVRMGAQGQLLAIAEMLVYLQVVLLFQEKSGRVYWQLLVLSLLQVVVAAALNLGPEFGILLAIYMALALATLVLLCMHREWRKGQASRCAPAKTNGPAWQALLAGPQQIFTTENDLALSGIARAWNIFRQAALLAAATVLFAAVFFCATPRISEGPWSGPRARGGGVNTGFAPEVVLKRFGRIHQSRELVMRVSLTRLSDRKPVILVGDPYFHGAALTDYVVDSGGSRWLPTQRRSLHRLLQPSRAVRPSLAGPHAVRQDINLENPHSSIVFAVMPAQPLVDTPNELHVAQTSNRIVRNSQSDEPRRDYQYSLGTPAIRNGRQLRGIPHYNPDRTVWDEYLLGVERADLLAIDRQQFPGLIAQAENILREQGLEDAGPLAKAEALERHFLTPDLYHYSLHLNGSRRRKVDQVEEFVVDHRTGNCEYFASALVLMLRSQGIPARMIVGYKGGELNSLGMYYQVHQRNAHSWVEAWLPPGAIPNSEIAGMPSDGGTWYRLDPTPGTESGLDSADEGPMHHVGEAFDYVELLWRDYVVSLNAARQKDTLFEPVSNRAFGSLPSLAEMPGLELLAKAARTSWLQEQEKDGQARNAGLFDWFSGAVVIGLVASVLMIAQIGMWLFHRVRLRPSRGETAKAQRPRPPAFYLRLQTLLGRMHLKRGRGQTPRELAAAAASRLKSRGHAAPVVEAPQGVVDAYYRVRFGGAALDKNELAAIEHALAQLAPAASESRP